MPLHSTPHTTTSGNTATSARVKKVKRPSISSAGTSEDWTYFLSRWEDYVAAAQVTGKDKIVQLLECCDDQLHKDFTRSAVSTLTNKTEENVLKYIEILAVREENVMVALVTLNSMHQDRDETICSFGGRLQGQASVCKYMINCPDCHREVNYTEPILRDALLRY